MLDVDNRQIMNIEMERSIAMIDANPFISTNKNYTYISSFKHFSQILSQDLLEAYYDSIPVMAQTLFMMKMTLSRTDQIHKIVYEKFTIPLA